MSAVAVTTDRRQSLTLVLAAALLGFSTVTIFTFSMQRYESATVLLAYTGGMRCC
jgi:hypothetical protein